MAAPVVVEGLPPAPNLRSAVLATCSDALDHRACIAREEHDPSAPSVRAVVAWPDGNHRHVRVALERGEAENARSIRDTYFLDEDPLLERWRAVGLVIAALVGESEAGDPPAAGEEHRREEAPAASRMATGWLGLSTWVGPGLDDGTLRAGAAATGAKAIGRLPVFVAVSAAYAFRPVDAEGVHVSWTTFGAGAGGATILPGPDIGLRARVEFIVEYLRADIDPPAANAPGSGARVTPGLRGSVDALWPASGPIGLTAGFAVWSLHGGTAIQLDQNKLGSSAWLSYAGMVGGQWSFH